MAGVAGDAAFGARAVAVPFAAGFGARAAPVRALAAPAVPVFAFDRLFVAAAGVFFAVRAATGFFLAVPPATGFLLAVPDFPDRAEAPRPSDFERVVFRVEEPFAEDFPAPVESSAPTLPVARAAVAGARAPPSRARVRALRVDDPAVLPVVATVVSEGIGAHERRRGK